MGWATGDPGLIAVRGRDFPLIIVWKLDSGVHITYCTTGPVDAVGPFERDKAVGA
jgi:hypothetical protein